MDWVLWIFFGLACLGGVIAYFDRPSAKNVPQYDNDDQADYQYCGALGQIKVFLRQQRCALWDGAKWIELPFSDIVDVEQNENGHVIQKAKSGVSLSRAAVGGLMFGPAGAVLGGLSGARETNVENETKEIFIRVFTKSLSVPVVDVHFRHFDPFLSCWSNEAEARKNAAEWFARLRSISLMETSPTQPL